MEENKDDMTSMIMRPTTDTTADKKAAEEDPTSLFQSNDSTFLRNFSSSDFRSSDSTAFLQSLVRSRSTGSTTSAQTSDSLVGKLLEEAGAISKLPPPPRRMPTRLQSLTRSTSNKIPEIFQSTAWAETYAPDHVDVNVGDVFQSTDSILTTATADKKPSAGPDWTALYKSQLTAVPAAPKPVEAADQKPAAVKRKRAPPVVPLPAPSSNTPSFVQLTEHDVIMGRGGRTNKHSGNMRYLALKDNMQQRYMQALKAEKTTIAQELVDAVHAWGGRFLKLEGDGWVEVDQLTARKKCSQSLREVNTPEVRAAKRARYNK